MKAIELTPLERQQIRHAAAVRRVDGDLLELTERGGATGGPECPASSLPQASTAPPRSVSSREEGSTCVRSVTSDTASSPAGPTPNDQAPAGLPSLAHIGPVLDLPEAQPVIRRLLEATGDGHARRFDVETHVLRVAADAIRARKNPRNNYARATL